MARVRQPGETWETRHWKLENGKRVYFKRTHTMGPGLVEMLKGMTQAEHNTVWETHGGRSPILEDVVWAPHV